MKKTDSIFGDEKKCSPTIHAHNVFFYDIESRLEERFECRFQVVNSRGDCVTLRKSCMFNDMNEIEEFKHSLPKHHLECLEIVKCRSHQPTLLCMVNSAQSLKKHFCETFCDDIVTSFFSWVVSDVLKPTNLKKDQKNDYVFVAHNGFAYDSHLCAGAPMVFLGAEMSMY